MMYELDPPYCWNPGACWPYCWPYCWPPLWRMGTETRSAPQASPPIGRTPPPMVAIESNFGLVVVRASRSRFAASALVKRFPRLVAGPPFFFLFRRHLQ